MQIQGSPISAEHPADPGIKDRFWYWTGASGRKYIHSIYSLEDCPPLPGAIYVAVRHEDHGREAVSVGRFQAFWECTLSASELRFFKAAGVNEIHVHLLSGSDRETELRFLDLQAALAEAEACQAHLPVDALPGFLLPA